MYITNKNKIKLPPRDPKSKKGDFGKVLVVGGSPNYYGAPILAASGAEYSGADLITLHLPVAYKDTARNYSLNFFLKGFHTDHLTSKDTKAVLEDSLENHVLIIGNGIGRDEESKQAVLAILSQISIPVVIDAEALFPEILKVKPAKAQWVVTPHRAEFVRLFEQEFSPETIELVAKQHGLVILAKCTTDYIADVQGNTVKNNTGSAYMRVGGTGDVLAGITGSFIAQGLSPFEAACSAAYYWGKSGTLLSQQRKWLTAYDMIKRFPEIIAGLDQSNML